MLSNRSSKSIKRLTKYAAVTVCKITPEDIINEAVPDVNKDDESAPEAIALQLAINSAMNKPGQTLYPSINKAANANPDAGHMGDTLPGEIANIRPN